MHADILIGTSSHHNVKDSWLISRQPLQATPTADTAMFYFQTNALGFTPEFLGRVRLAGSLASLAGKSSSATPFCHRITCPALARVAMLLARIAFTLCTALTSGASLLPLLLCKWAMHETIHKPLIEGCHLQEWRCTTLA